MEKIKEYEQSISHFDTDQQKILENIDQAKAELDAVKAVLEGLITDESIATKLLYNWKILNLEKL